MITRSRNKASAAETRPAPPAAVVPDDFAAQAARYHREADEARGRAVEARATAERQIADAAVRAARIVHDADVEARAVKSGATAAEREAARLDERAQRLTHAATLEAQAAEANAVADSLQDEREQRAAQIAGLDERIEAFRAERQDIEERRAAALRSLDRVTAEELRREVDATDAVLAEAGRQRETLQARLAEIGDGTGRGQLFETLTSAGTLRAELRSLLNLLDPERPEAKADELLAIIQANAERVASELAQTATRRRPLIVR
jgi:hypothetical protein